MMPAVLARLHAASFDHSRPWSMQEFASLLEAQGSLLVHEAQGFALGRVIGDEAELLTIAVMPEARSAGLGRRLLEGFLAQAQAQGAATVFLEVAVDNIPALALYTSAGFDRAGLRPGYYAGPGGRKSDALVLVYALGGTSPGF